MVRRYDYETVDVIWWYVKPERVARTKEIVAQLAAEDRVEVRPWLVQT
jgi:hypothetical protein